MRDEIRERAVAQVDKRHGYTVEFASDPSFHLREYDIEEEAIRLYLEHRSEAQVIGIEPPPWEFLREPERKPWREEAETVLSGGESLL